MAKLDIETYLARGGMTKQDVHAAVRLRDQNQCGVCGMSDLEHAHKHGVRLHVHRLVPGSLYTVAGCQLRCFACHGREPKRGPKAPRLDSQSGFYVRLPWWMREPLDELARKTGRTMTAEVVIALEEYLKKAGVKFEPQH